MRVLIMGECGHSAVKSMPNDFAEVIAAWCHICSDFSVATSVVEPEGLSLA